MFVPKSVVICFPFSLEFHRANAASYPLVEHYKLLSYRAKASGEEVNSSTYDLVQPFNNFLVQIVAAFGSLLDRFLEFLH